jgi:hypothetical protein
MGIALLVHKWVAPMEIAIRVIAQGAIVRSKPRPTGHTAKMGLRVLKMASATILGSVMAEQWCPVLPTSVLRAGVTLISVVRKRISPAARAVAMMVTAVLRVIIARTVIVIVAQRKTAMTTILVPMTDVCLEIVGTAPIQAHAMMATSVPPETRVAMVRA